jgi:diguanylate cyclase (GGDEF)-like protein
MDRTIPVREDLPLLYALIALGAACFVAALIGLSALTGGEWIAAAVGAMVLILAGGRVQLILPVSRSFLSLGEPVVFAALLFSGTPLAIALAGLDGLVGARPREHAIRSRILNLAIMSLSVGFAGRAFELLAPTSFRATHRLDGLVLPISIAAALHFVLNSSLVATIAARRRGLPVLATWWHNYLWAVPSYLIAAGSALAAYVAADWFGPLALLIGLPLAVVMLVFYSNNVRRLEQNEQHISQLRDANEQFMQALALAIEARDPRARGHARAVQAYALEIAQLIQRQPPGATLFEPVDQAWVESLGAAALLHDVGKLALPDQLLYKRTGLLESERERVRQHAVLGEAMVARLNFSAPIGPFIRHHHEHWDGSGYPDRLEGAAIPLGARILALADSLEAARREILTSTAQVDPLIRHVARQAGNRLDPRLVELYCRHADAIEGGVASRLDAARPQLATLDADRRLYDGIDSAREDAIVVLDLTRQMSATIDLEATMSNAMRGLMRVVPASSAAIYLFDEATGQLRCRHALGSHSEAFGRRGFVPGEGICGWVFQTRQTVLNADPRVDLGSDSDQIAPALQSAMLCPLLEEDSVLGVLAFYSDQADAYSLRHRQVVEALVAQITRAIRNALLFEATRSTSMTDALTGLPNSRYLYAQIDKELGRATRRTAPLCVAVMDLDGFKSINDTYGHNAGDVVLRRVGALMSETFRAGDTIVRYAGDEFVALLPETSPEECRQILQRIQAQIGETEIAIPGDRTVRVGVSAGSACFPLDGSTLEDLIHRADKEMYKDKLARKSQVPAK